MRKYQIQEVQMHLLHNVLSTRCSVSFRCDPNIVKKYTHVPTKNLKMIRYDMNLLDYSN